MPPKKENKKQTTTKVDNSGMPKNEVDFKFFIQVRSDAAELPFAILSQWFVSSDKIQRWQTPTIDTWKKTQNMFSFQKDSDTLRIDEDFCKLITSRSFFIYFQNADDNTVAHALKFDYSSLLTRQTFVFESKTINIFGIDSFTIKLTADKPLLGDVFKHYLNPFEVQVIGARDVPIQSSNKYEPAYVKYAFFDGSIIQTQGIVGHKQLTWEHKHVFLVGLADPDDLKEKIRSKYLKFDFHDRDTIRDTKTKQEINVFDIGKAIMEEVEKQKPIEEDPKKKGAKKQEKKQQKKQNKKEGKKDLKKRQKLGEPILSPVTQKNKSSYGIAAYSLKEFLRSAMRVSEYVSPVVPRNTFEDYQSKNIDLNTTARNDMQKIFSSSNYFECDTTLFVKFTLSHSIGTFIKPIPIPQPVDPKNKEPIKPVQLSKVPTKIFFERVVFMIPYKDAATVKLIEDIFYQHNMKVMNLSNKREVTTCLLNSEQRNGTQLNFISGIQIIDPQGRIYILQGIHNKAFDLLHKKMVKTQQSIKQMKIFKNSNLTYTKRLYGDFNIQLKRIRLMPSLNDILIRPSVYIQSKVAEDISLNLTRMGDIRNLCSDLGTVDGMNLWPTADSLIQIERKFSQSLSFEDIYGQQANKPKKAIKLDSLTQTIQFSKPIQIQYFTKDQFFLPHAQQTIVLPMNEQTKISNRKNILTQTFCQDQSKKNPSYQMRGRKAEIASNELVYIYAGQKLNFYDKQMKEVRQKLQANPKKVLTYSKEHLALTINPYTLQEEHKKQLNFSQSKVFNQKQQFSSLLVKTQQERMKLPKRPSDEDALDLLKYPYHEQKQREKQLKKNIRDEPLANGLPQFQKYIKQPTMFSTPQVIPDLIQQKNNLNEAKQSTKKTENIKIKKGKSIDKSSGIDRFDNIREGPAVKLGLIDVHKRDGVKRVIQPYQVSLFKNQIVNNPSINPLIRKDQPSLNLFKDQFNFYQRPQILTASLIHKPLKKDL